MASRFYCDSPIIGDTAVLGDAESRHLLQVMRKQPGDQVILFDGLGSEYLATITKSERRTVSLSIDQRIDKNRELDIDLTLAVALPKGDRQSWMIQKLVELGVTRLVPLITERGVAQPTGKAIDRLQRNIIEASKQCGRNRLMNLSSPVHLPEVSSIIDSSSQRFIAHVRSEAEDRPKPHGNVAFAVGPEGGFTEVEVQSLIESGWKTIHLGQRILRIETAAVSVAAWWSLSCG